jgi:hypothetical protein
LKREAGYWKLKRLQAGVETGYWLLGTSRTGNAKSWEPAIQPQLNDQLPASGFKLPES